MFASGLSIICIDLSITNSRKLLGIIVCVPCGKTGSIALMFLMELFTSENYLAMLGNLIMPELDLFGSCLLWFMQDGGPPHYGFQVCQWLDEHFPCGLGVGIHGMGSLIFRFKLIGCCFIRAT